MHADLLSGRVAGATLAAVYDASAERAEEVATRLGVPATGTGAELIDLDDVDAIAICTSTETHVDAIVAAAATGKPIFCEKPVSLDLAEVDRGIAAVDRGRGALQVGFNRRFDPAHRSVRDAVSAGDGRRRRISSASRAATPRHPRSSTRAGRAGSSST